MAKANKQAVVIIDGSSLTLEDLANLVNDPKVKVRVAPAALEQINKSYYFLKREAQQRIIYGINTGFGPMADKVIGKTQLLELQENLIRSHATGMGKPLDQGFVMAAMAVRLNTLCKGYSGVSPELIDRLAYFINNRIIPVVPEHGAVGTSGDLTQLAHISLALMGEGEVFYGNTRQSAKKLLRDLKLKPYVLQPKEGLALINGSSLMAGVGALLCREADNLIEIACVTAALAMEATKSFTDGIAQTVQAVRPHPGQKYIADRLRKILSGSRRPTKRQAFANSLKPGNDIQHLQRSAQEVYSIRCAPQVLGPIFDTVQNAKQVIETEINSVTDNPIVDAKHFEFLHGGNFHGDYVASTLDKLKAAIIKLTMLSERRINFFFHDKKNQMFPPFLNLQKPGLTLALQGLQFVATSTTAQSQSLGYPHHLHSIPTNGENQDIVSMGSDAALFTHKAIDNAYIVLTIELVTIAQAMDCTGELKKYSKTGRKWYSLVKEDFPKLKNDRYMSGELEKLEADLISLSV